MGVLPLNVSSGCADFKVAQLASFSALGCLGLIGGLASKLRISDIASIVCSMTVNVNVNILTFNMNNKFFIMQIYVSTKLSMIVKLDTAEHFIFAACEYCCELRQDCLRGY